MKVIDFFQTVYRKQNTLEHNVWKFTVHKVTLKRTYMTFMTIFLLLMPNATAQTIGLLTLVGQIAGFLFEVPSGYIADRIGHKEALVLGRAAMVISTGLYVFADHIWYFFVATVFLSLGWAFESGTGSAFMHETLSGLSKEDQYARIMGKIKSIGFAIPVLLIILLAVIADESFRAAFSVALVIDLIGLGVVLLFVTPNNHRDAGELVLDNLMSVLKSFLRVGWLPYVVVGALLSGITLGATIGFKNPYQEMLGLSITVIGIFWALSRVLISGMLLFNGWIYKQFSFKQFLLLETSITGLGLLSIGLTTDIWLVAGLFVLAGVPIWGLASAREQYYLSFLHGHPSKATMLSVGALFGKIVIGVFGLIMGALVLDVAFQNAYLVVGGALLLLGIGIVLFLPSYSIIRSSESDILKV